MEQPSTGTRNRCATITDIEMGNTPSAPPPSTGWSIVANTLKIRIAVPNASATKIWPPLNTLGSQEFDAKVVPPS